MDAISKACIIMQIKATAARDKIREFLQSQKGVSNVVATIIILLIVVILIGVFWERLSAWVTEILDKIFGQKLPDASDMGGSF